MVDWAGGRSLRSIGLGLLEGLSCFALIIIIIISRSDRLGRSAWVVIGGGQSLSRSIGLGAGSVWVVKGRLVDGTMGQKARHWGL
jgi:hypothetical protein